jgi:6-phosphogluconolactonase
MRMTGHDPGEKKRPRLRALIWLLAVLLTTAANALAAEYRVYVGTYTGKGSEGIYAFRFNPVTGATSSVGLAAATDNPSFLAVHPNGRFLYAVNELDTFHGEPAGALSAFAIDRGSGKLELLQQVSSLGAGPAHVSLDRTARYLLVANYNGGNVAVFPLGDDGRLGRPTAFVQGEGRSVNPERQAGPHAHSFQVTRDNRFALAADLGLDKLFVHRFDSATGSLAPGSPGFVQLDPGSGPRHVALSPSGKFVYVLNELASTVAVFAFEPGAGALHMIQAIPTLPADFNGLNTAAEIVVDAKGRFLYVSNRGHDSIAVLGIDPDNGKLNSLEWVPSGGRTPRHFAIDPTGNWLVAANQDSNNISLFRIDPRNGRLRLTDPSLRVVSPNCVRIVPFK